MFPSKRNSLVTLLILQVHRQKWSKKKHTLSITIQKVFHCINFVRSYKIWRLCLNSPNSKCFFFLFLGFFIECLVIVILNELIVCCKINEFIFHLNHQQVAVLSIYFRFRIIDDLIFFFFLINICWSLLWMNEFCKPAVINWTCIACKRLEKS